MAVSKFRLSQAVASVSSLREVIGQLTEEEVLAALDLESATKRRPSIVGRLLKRAIRLNEIAYSTSLKEKYHGNP